MRAELDLQSIRDVQYGQRIGMLDRHGREHLRQSFRGKRKRVQHARERKPPLRLHRRGIVGFYHGWDFPNPPSLDRLRVLVHQETDMGGPRLHFVDAHLQQEHLRGDGDASFQCRPHLSRVAKKERVRQKTL